MNVKEAVIQIDEISELLIEIKKISKDKAIDLAVIIQRNMIEADRNALQKSYNHYFACAFFEDEDLGLPILQRIERHIEKIGNSI